MPRHRRTSPSCCRRRRRCSLGFPSNEPLVTSYGLPTLVTALEVRPSPLAAAAARRRCCLLPAAARRSPPLLGGAAGDACARPLPNRGGWQARAVLNTRRPPRPPFFPASTWSACG